VEDHIVVGKYDEGGLGRLDAGVDLLGVGAAVDERLGESDPASDLPRLLVVLIDHEDQPIARSGHLHDVLGQRLEQVGAIQRGADYVDHRS
jgi:hypothetical protein